MSQLVFKKCDTCGNIVRMVKDTKVPVFCCGKVMDQLVPNSTDAAGEKHVPVVNVEDKVVKVDVGSVTHPMSDEHHIAWIYLETKLGGQMKYLAHDGEPHAVFSLTCEDELLAVYEYCNLHGLWVKEVK